MALIGEQRFAFAHPTSTSGSREERAAGGKDAWMPQHRHSEILLLNLGKSDTINPQNGLKRTRYTACVHYRAGE